MQTPLVNHFQTSFDISQEGNTHEERGGRQDDDDHGDPPWQSSLLTPSIYLSTNPRRETHMRREEAGRA
jgi:hypothetical protein